ncbi:MAG: hypothetical protein RL514_3188 [Verrucomicrobiota bacterium]|jgi:hypothetical protein
MNPDSFEQRLSRQPLRPVPAEWRDAVLARAGDLQSRSLFAAMASDGEYKSPAHASLWERLFGPNPLAWAGLAAVWVLLFAVNRSGSESATSSASRASQQSETAVAEIVRERRREMAELLNLDEPRATLPARDALPPKRSQRREDFAVV